MLSPRYPLSFLTLPIRDPYSTFFRELIHIHRIICFLEKYQHFQYYLWMLPTLIHHDPTIVIEFHTEGLAVFVHAL